MTRSGNMTETLPIFTLAGNSTYQVSSHKRFVLSRGESNGETYITGMDMVVYISYPCLNLRTGKTHELWLTKDQVNYFQGGDWEPPHPRMFDLPKIGLPKRGYQPPVLEGFFHPGSSTCVTQDKGGHWWSCGQDQGGVRPYMVEHPESHRSEKLQFLYPYMSHLGSGDNIQSRSWGDDTRATRLTLCTHDVCDVINEAKVWGYYFPSGRARTNVKLATKQAKKFRAEMRDYAEMGERLTEANTKLAGAQDEVAQLSQEVQSNKIQLDTYEKAKKDLTTELSVVGKLLEKARERIESLEADASVNTTDGSINWNRL